LPDLRSLWADSGDFLDLTLDVGRELRAHSTALRGEVPLSVMKPHFHSWEEPPEKGGKSGRGKND